VSFTNDDGNARTEIPDHVGGGRHLCIAGSITRQGAIVCAVNRDDYLKQDDEGNYANPEDVRKHIDSVWVNKAETVYGKGGRYVELDKAGKVRKCYIKATPQSDLKAMRKPELEAYATMMGIDLCDQVTRKKYTAVYLVHAILEKEKNENLADNFVAHDGLEVLDSDSSDKALFQAVTVDWLAEFRRLQDDLALTTLCFLKRIKR
jgi:hypothetical protein